MTTTQKFILVPVLALTILGGGAMLGYAQLSSADMNGMGRGMGMMGGMTGYRGEKHGVHGEITAISGTTITVEGINGTTYTVEASDAKVRVFTDGEGLDEGDFNDLEVGDIVGVRGSVDGTNVDATDIMRGDHPRMGGSGWRRGPGGMGEVTAIDGTKITLKTLRGDTLTIDASDAQVSRVVEGSLGDINVGDQIGVHGERDGDTVKAEYIMDDVPQRSQDN